MRKWARELKEMRDQRDEQMQKVAELIESKRMADGQIKAYEIELAAARQDITTLMKVSEDFQEKFDVLTEKEAEVNSKSWEYTKRIQELDAEKDKYSLHENKYKRELEKLADEHKDELQMKSDRYEKMLKATKNGYDDKLQRKNEEIHNLKITNEELEERVKLLDEQLRQSNMRLDQLYKLEVDRKTFF